MIPVPGESDNHGSSRYGRCPHQPGGSRGARGYARSPCGPEGPHRYRAGSQGDRQRQGHPRRGDQGPLSAEVVSRSRWELVVAPSAERTLSRLPEKAAAAVVEFMLGPLVADPKRVGHPLRGELQALWAARRGPYRVVYELDEAAREVRVLRVDHRADIYRPR